MTRQSRRRRLLSRLDPTVLFLAAAVCGSVAAHAAAAPPDPPAAPDSQFSPPVVSFMEFRGLETVDSVDVRPRLTLVEGDLLDRRRLAASVRALFSMGVFSMIQVASEPQDDGSVRLLWTVYERPRVVAVDFEGCKHLEEEDLRGKIGLRAGKLLDRYLLEKDRKALATAYEEEGFSQAEVEPVVEPAEGGVRVVYRTDEGKRAKIREIAFEGNEALSDDDLRGTLSLKKKSLFRKGRFNREKFEQDKERIVEEYKNNGYKDARVVDARTEFRNDGEDLALTFAVEEGPLYVFGGVDWEGCTVFTEEELLRTTRVAAGDPFSQKKVDETLSDAYALYMERGYLLGLFVDPSYASRSDTVDVVFEVHEGEPSHVREVAFNGNTRTREYVIRREVGLAPGDLLRRSLLMRSQRDVMALGFFEEVIPDYRAVGDGTTDIDVLFGVKERSTGTASAGAGFSSDTGLTGFLDLGHNNLFGRGQAVQFHIERGSRRKDYRFSFTEPWLMGRPTSLGADVFNTERILDIYTEKRRGGSVRVGRPWIFRWPDFSRIFLGYTLEDLSFSDLQDLDEASQEFLLSGAGTISEVSLTFLRSSTDNPFYPTEGSVARLRTEVAGGPLGGDLDFVKSTLDLQQYLVPFWKPALMLRSKVGHLTSIGSKASPGNETFRLGGTTFEHLRGYDDYFVVPEENVRLRSDGREIRFPGGKFMYIFTAEYQFPLVNPVHGLFFFDAGNTWNRVNDFNLLDLKKGVGLGIRLEIPMLGRVGLDYAYGIDRGKFRTHLVLGPAF